MDRRSFLRTAFAAGAWLASEGLTPLAEAATPPEAQARFPWAWSVNLDVHAMAADVFGYLPYLDAAATLGVQMVRLDAYWADLEPERGLWVAAHLDWLVALAKAASDRKLGLVVNLCGYPRWALADLEKAPDRFFSAQHRYTASVAGALGDSVSYYQLGNEFNTILDPIPANRDAQVFLTGAKALASVNARYPWGTARTVINPFYGFDNLGSDWSGALNTVLSAASSAIDVLALDYYPASYDFWDDPGQWSPLADLASYARRYNKRLAIGETGCPSYALGEQRQADWYVRSLSGLAREVRALNLQTLLCYVNLFELADRPPLQPWEFWRPTEVTLGLTTRDLRPKEAFYTLQRLLSDNHVTHLASRPTPATKPSK